MLKTALIFQDHMTLQRDKIIPIWGTAAAGSQISVTVQNMTQSCIAAESGNWYVKIGPLQPSFRETVMITDGKDNLCISDVQVGDVYLAAGQSNMEFHMRLVRKHALQSRSVRFKGHPVLSG